MFALLRYRIADWIIGGELRAIARLKNRHETEAAIMRASLVRIINLQSVRHDNPNKDFNKAAIKIAKEALDSVGVFVRACGDLKK